MVRSRPFRLGRHLGDGGPVVRVLLLSGGRSAEHDVSLVSGGFVGDVLSRSGHTVTGVLLDRDGSWRSTDGHPLSIDASAIPWRLRGMEGPLAFDVVFPVLHGPWGEDGTVQGLCSLAGWPCAGAGVMTSSLAMNKAATKRLISASGIPVLPWMSFTAANPPTALDLAPLGYPLFVKPSRMGSSVGISRVTDAAGLPQALEEAFRYDSLMIVEKGLESPREIEVSLLGEFTGVSTSVPGEVVPGKEWYTYEAKYDCPESRLLIPAPIPEAAAVLAREYAGECFRSMDGRGFARADFLLDREGLLYFNEINTIPGFTAISMFAKLWEASGVAPGMLLSRILDDAVQRFSRGGAVPD
jgi:D-alanine-D-alanine ligase